MDDDVERDFDTGSVASGTGRLHCRAAGDGDLVVDLVSDAVPTRFHRLLARQFRVVILNVPNSGSTPPQGVAASLGDLAAAAARQRCSLVLRGAALPLALQMLRERPGLVNALVLLAPPPGDDSNALEALSAAAVPLLVLSGTRGMASPPEAGSRFRARVRNCNYVLVYDAGDTIEIDRPEATASLVSDFLVHRERFIVSHASGLIHP